MASEINICNQALAEIGARSTISSFTEQSPAATNCGIFYDPLRRALLRRAPWGFCRKQEALTLLGSAINGTSLFPWQYMYAYPSDATKVRYLTAQLANDSTDVIPTDGLVVPYYASRRYRFLVALRQIGSVQTKVLLCNVPQAIAVYNADITNVDFFDPMFWEAMVAGLASKLIIPLTGNVGMKNSYIQNAELQIAQALAADGNEAIPTTDHTPDWIAARGWPSDGYGFGDFNQGPGYWGEAWDSPSWGS